MDPREREAREAKQRQNQELLDRAYDRVISAQLSKISSKKTFTEDDEEAYRQKIAKDREVAQSKKRKTISAEQAELARTTGLSGQVVALMAGHDDNGIDDATNDSERSGDRKRKKKSKKKHKKKDSKKSSSKGRRKERKRDYYSSGSDDSYSSADSLDDRGEDRDRSSKKFDDSSFSDENREGKRERKSRHYDSDSGSDSSRSRDRDRKKSKKRTKHRSRSSSKRSKR